MNTNAGIDIDVALKAIETMNSSTEKAKSKEGIAVLCRPGNKVSADLQEEVYGHAMGLLAQKSLTSPQIKLLKVLLEFYTNI
mgnify:CR=1 FL=1|tara:strand:- start:86 stop:331 length:246 start_codon:yes stop_codon:yes gene_type:complete